MVSLSDMKGTYKYKVLLLLKKIIYVVFLFNDNNPAPQYFF